MSLKRIEKIIIAFGFIVLLIMPFIVRSNLYYLGGDDMRLYYLYPDKYLQNYVFNIATDNTLAGAATGYATVAYYAPIMYVFSFLKFVPLNTQTLAYGLNSAFAFLFFYLLTGFFIEIRNYKTIIIRIISSLFYVFSPIFLYSFYKNQLLSLYLISVIPAFLYFFVKALDKKKIAYIFISALIITLFSGTIANLPWLTGSLLPMIFILIPFIKLNLKVFVIYSIVFVASLLLINIYWIFHFVNSSIGGGIYTSAELVIDNVRVTKGVASMFTPLNQIFLTLAPRFKDISSVFYINIIFFLVITFSSVVLKAKEKTSQNKHNFVLLGFLVSWFLVNPNIGKWGSDFFVWMSINIPFWGMFRNMHDKFAIAFAIYYALAFTISFSLLSEKINKKTVNIISLIILIILIINNQSFFKNKLTINDTDKLVSGEFNNDFNNLTNYILNNNNDSYARILWLPLNGPTYVNIEDSKTNNFYSGLSPYRILVDKNDLTGRFSFIHKFNWFVGDKIFEKLFDGDTKAAASEIAKANIDLVIVDNQILPDKISEFMYGGQEKKYLSSMADLQAELLGENINNFGDKYSVYEINPEYRKQSNIKKISSSEFIYTHDESSTVINFYEPFSEHWQLYTNGNLLSTQKHNLLDDWANQWILAEDSLIQGGEVSIIFSPAKKTKQFNYISIFSFIIIVISTSYLIIKDYKDEK